MSHPKVTLDAVGCCALTHAFLRHPAHVRELGRNVGQFQVFFEIFQSSLRLSFTPNELTAMIYRAFAKAEVKRLGESRDARLLCRHSRAAHANALTELLRGLPEHATN